VSGSGISWAICVSTSLQTDNHASTPLLIFYRLDALPATQPTASKQSTKPQHDINKFFKNSDNDVNFKLIIQHKTNNSSSISITGYPV